MHKLSTTGVTTLLLVASLILADLNIGISLAMPEPEGEGSSSNKQTPTDETQNRQFMTIDRLMELVELHGNNIERHDSNTLSFTYDNAQLIMVVSKQANRMRLISPVVAANELTEEQLAAVLVSNFHLALDARYAVGDGVLYTAYIHPLKELTDAQLVSAIRQVATLRNTFGTAYTSGEMSFGVPQPERTDI